MAGTAPQEKTVNADKSITIGLEHPFKWGEEEVSELTIPRVKLYHLRNINQKKMEDGDLDEIFKLLKNILNQPPKYLDLIDMADFEGIMEVIELFMPASPQTGKKV